MYSKNDFEAREFLSCAFNPHNARNEIKLLITLTGAPDPTVILWNWESQKALNKISLGITGNNLRNFQVSYNPAEPGCILVSGNDTFRYMRIDESSKKYEFSEEHTQVNNADRVISNKYSCHCWTNVGKLIVCTEIGEIFECEDGAFSGYIPDSPTNDDIKIEAIMPYSRGFVVAANQSKDNQETHGKFYVFQENQDPRYKYKLLSSSPDMKLPYTVEYENVNLQTSNMTYAISSMAFSITSEDMIYFTTKSNQIMKVEIPLYETGDVVRPKFDYVHSFFHTNEITGLDVCIRKQLVVTCSKDKTIKVWNYATRTLEISQTTAEDALAVTFHPSGFHMIVALLDKINIFNVLSK